MLIRHMLRFLPAQVLAPAAQLVSMVLWTHYLAPAQMGIFTLVSVAQEMAYAVGLSWFSIYALRYVPAAADAAALRRFLGTENAVVLASTVLALLLGVLTAATLPADPPGVHTHLARDGLVIGLFFATRALNAHYAERARAQSAFVAYTLLQTSGPVGAIGLGLLALRQFEPSAFVLLGAYAAAQLLGALLALPLLRMHWRLARPDTHTLRAAFTFGAPVLALGVLGWVAENYIRYLVQWQSGAVALGLMIVGWSLGRRCAAVATMLVTTAAFPLASRLLNEGRRTEALAQLSTNAALVLAVLAPVSAGLALLGPLLVDLTVAPEYRAVTAALLGWSVLGGALRNLHVHVTDQLMVLDRRLRLLAAVNVAEIVACAAASLAGLLLWDLRGALVGQAVGSLLALALSRHWAQRRLGLHWPWSASWRILLATAVMAAALLLLQQATALTGLPGLLAGSAVGTAVYAAALSMLFARQARGAAASLWQRWRSARQQPEGQQAEQQVPDAG